MKQKTFEGITILLLEDSFILALDVKQALNSLGATVVGPFADTLQARHAFESEKIDLALLDIQVRNGTSLNLAAEITEKNIPCVFLSGYGAHYEMPANLAEIRHLQKPFDVKEATKVLMSALGLKEHGHG